MIDCFCVFLLHVAIVKTSLFNTALLLSVNTRYSLLKVYLETQGYFGPYRVTHEYRFVGNAD